MLRRKHIQAPATFDPGPGHPRERLAYLNDAEMEMLRRLTDGRSDPGPRGIPSFAVTSGTTSGTTMGGGSKSPSGGGPSGGPGGIFGPARQDPSTGKVSSGVTGGGGKGGTTAGSSRSDQASEQRSVSSAGKPAGGVSAPSATSGLGGSKSPSSASPSRTTTPSSPMGGQGGLSKSQVDAYKGYGASRAANPGSPVGPASPMGGQGTSFGGTPSRAAEANARTASAIKGGQNPSGSQKVASGVSQSQKDAYTQFGQKMAAAPRQPEVPRSPGDAEQLARMGMAENGLIRDPVTGKMSELANQGTLDVVRNRMENQSLDVQGVISQKDQFSPWGNGSYASTPPDPARTAMAEAVLRGVTPDYTVTPSMPQGADFYHNADTVNKDKGYQKASAVTKDRINNNFTGGLSVNDGLGGPWGHTYGVSADGSLATQRGPQPMGAPRNGATNYGTGAGPTSLPQGALSPNPNYGGIEGNLTSQPSSHVPGRFGGMRPDLSGGVAKISADGMPAEDYGTIGLGFNVNRNIGYNSRFEDQLNEFGELRDYQNPNQFSNVREQTGFYTDRVGPGGTSLPIGGSWSNGFDPNKLNPDAQHLYDAMVDTELRTGVPRDYFSGKAGRDYNGDGIDDTPQHPIGAAIDSRVMDPRTGAPVGGVYNPKGLTGANKAAYDNAANAVLDTMYQNPDMYGGLGPRTRYGGDFMSGPVPGDQMHMDVMPGGAFSSRQTARHEDALARAEGIPGAGGYNLASAVSPNIIGMSQPQAPEVSPSIYNGLKALPGAISGLGQGIRNLSETISTPMPAAAKAFLGSVNSPNGIVKSLARTGFEAAVGPRVKEAASAAISGLKNIADPNNPRAQAAEAERRAGGSSSTTKKSGPTASGVREAQRGEQREGSKTASATKRGGRNPEQGKGGDRETNRQDKVAETRAQKAKRIGKKKIEDLTKPEPKAADWSSYTNVMTKEQALRKLLGEEWYAA